MDPLLIAALVAGGLKIGQATGLFGTGQSPLQSQAPQPYQPPPPPPPANTHGIGETGMTPNQLAMINPRTQVSQALLKQRMGG